MKFPTKIPTILGILLVVASVAAVVFVTNALKSPSQASESQKPNNVRVTNLSHTSFTVSWVTQTPATGALLVITPKKPNTVYYDERDKSGKLGKYLTHSITVRDATADTDYFFKPASESKPYLNDGKPYFVHTPQALPINDSGLDPAFGVIRTAGDAPLGDAIVYVTLEGGQDLSALTKPSGTWLIPLNQTRTADLTAYLPVIERMSESVTVLSGIESASAVTDSLNDSPVPDMNMGKEYDFRRQQAKTSGNSNQALRATPRPIALVPTAKATLPVDGAVLGESTAKPPYTVSITSPKKGAAFPTTLPLFQGTGIPGKFIGLSIGFINPIHSSVKVGNNGIWMYTPTRQLNTGKQTVTISSVDPAGRPVAITHEFSILKSGTQVLGDATPSATLTPITTLTTTPEATVSEAPTETPVSTQAGNPPPTSGNELPAIILLILGFGLLAGGSVAFMR